MILQSFLRGCRCCRCFACGTRRTLRGTCFKGSAGRCIVLRGLGFADSHRLVLKPCAHFFAAGITLAKFILAT